MSEVQQHAGNVDVDRADLTARTTEAGSAGELRSGMHPRDQRREDRSDGTGIHTSVGVTTDLSIDGAHVQACTATDAPKGFGGEVVFEEFRPSVVEQNQVNLFRAVVFEARLG